MVDGERVEAVRVLDLVQDRRDGHVRWAVAAVFVGVDEAEPRCVDYRVRVVPRVGDRLFDSIRAGRQILALMEQDPFEAEPVWSAALTDAPAEGIPNYVFAKASQARLLAKAKASAQRNPDRYEARTKALLERQTAPKRRGRPPVRTLAEKLRILQTAEEVFADGGTRKDIAARHHMSESSVRDLLSWARRDCDPPLFTSHGPSRRGGALTAAARAMIKEVGNE